MKNKEITILDYVVSKNSGKKGVVVGFENNGTILHIRSNLKKYKIDINLVEKIVFKEGDRVYCYGFNKYATIIGYDEGFKDFIKIEIDGKKYSINKGALKYES